MSGSVLSHAVIADLVGDLHTSSDERVAVFAPFTGEVLHELQHSSVEDVTDAACTARAAQRSWAAAGFVHRRRVLLTAHDLLLQRQELLLDAVQSETGKTRSQAFEEVAQALNATRYSALKARSVLKTRPRRAAIPFVTTARVGYRPKGLVGVVTPWNFPLSLTVMDIAPALAAGNGILQKIDDQAVLTALATRRAFVDAGLPTELWRIVTGPGSSVGDAITDTVDYVCFTGSTATGRLVGERAARRLIGASLELGGKNPIVVLDDVRPELAAKKAAYASFSALGQLCVSGERLYVQRGAVAAVEKALVEQLSSLTQSGAFDFSADLGSLTLPAQLERLEAHIADAVSKGASVIAGGRRRPELGPLFFEPTVLTGVTPEMACFREETFGPLISLYVFDTEDEVVALANDSEFGLNASILSGSRARARRLAERIDAGSVNINEGYRATFAALDAPMGGMKDSGLGRRNGPEGLLRFVESRTVAAETGLLRLPSTSREWARLRGTMTLMLRVFRMIRRG